MNLNIYKTTIATYWKCRNNVKSIFDQFSPILEINLLEKDLCRGRLMATK